MYEIVKLNKISPIIDGIFGDNYRMTEGGDPDGIILRSFNMADYKVGGKLKAIARAGAGVNNIPVDKMTEKGIVVFNTPGANANAVKELVLCAMLLASRDIIGGIKWVNTLDDDVEKTTEKGKGAFAGKEILGKTVGIIGLGAIGVMVANACIGLGMEVLGYDMCLSEQAKNKLNEGVKITTLEEIYQKSDIISIHIPLNDSTRNIIGRAAIGSMKKGVVIINMSRAALVDVVQLKLALDSGKVDKYVVDFPTQEVLNYPNIIAIPHLGASTAEAEDNCAVMASNQLVDYLQNGNIENSVNFPNITKKWDKKYRTVILFKSGYNLTNDALDVKVAACGGVGVAIVDTDESWTVARSDNVLRVIHLAK